MMVFLQSLKFKQKWMYFLYELEWPVGLNMMEDGYNGKDT